MQVYEWVRGHFVHNNLGDVINRGFIKNPSRALEPLLPRLNNERLPINTCINPDELRFMVSVDFNLQGYNKLNWHGGRSGYVTDAVLQAIVSGCVLA
jgi:hypothetical protein